MNPSPFLPPLVAAAVAACGWLGLELADPEIAVLDSRVRLEEPLRVREVAAGSPAVAAGLAAGMEILAVDGERWDEARFVEPLERLYAAGAGERRRLLVRGADGERTVELRAAACDEGQEQRRGRRLAGLARMEGAAWSRFHGHPAAYLQSAAAAERVALDEARREYERGLQQVEDYLSDPEVEERLGAQLEEARERQIQVLRDPQVLRSLERAREAYESARRRLRHVLEDDAEVRRSIERALRRMERAGSEDARTAMRDFREQFEQAVQLAAEARALDLDRTARDHALAERYHEMARELAGGAAAGAEQIALLERLTARQTEQAAELLERRSELGALHEALDSLQAERGGLREDALASLRRRLDRDAAGSLRESLDRLRTDRMLHEARRALDASTRGREARARVLADAAREVDALRRAVDAVGDVRLSAVGREAAAGVEGGLRVEALGPGSALAAAGVREGEILVSLEGRALRSGADLLEGVRERLEELREGGEREGAARLEVQGLDGRRTVELPLQVPPPGAVGPI